MAVLIPRIRTLGVRLSEEEYAALEKFSVENGARSLSDMARTAICTLVNRANPETALASSVNQNAAHVKELEEKVERLSAEIVSLRDLASRHRLPD